MGAEMERGWLNLPYVAWAAICLAVAVVYSFAWPHQPVSAETGPLRFFLVRWGHSLAWALLAGMCLLKATGQQSLAGWGSAMGLLALPVYFGFLIASFVLH